jgi:hypothetical protein
MRPRDWFCVGVRLIGVWLFTVGLGHLLAAFASMLRPRTQFSDDPDLFYRHVAYALYIAGYCFPAAYLLFGAEHLTRWVFKEKSSSDDDGATAISIGGDQP